VYQVSFNYFQRIGINSCSSIGNSLPEIFTIGSRLFGHPVVCLTAHNHEYFGAESKNCVCKYISGQVSSVSTVITDWTTAVRLTAEQDFSLRQGTETDSGSTRSRNHWISCFTDVMVRVLATICKVRGFKHCTGYGILRRIKIRSVVFRGGGDEAVGPTSYDFKAFKNHFEVWTKMLRRLNLSFILTKFFLLCY
jgi:hypothetical protein